MNAKEFLEKMAKSYKLSVRECFHGDFDLRPLDASNVIQFCALMDEAGYYCSFKKNNIINIKAPHHKKHERWDASRGWDCVHGLTVQGCEMFRGDTEATDTEKLRAGLRGRQMAR